MEILNHRFLLHPQFRSSKGISGCIHHWGYHDMDTIALKLCDALVCLNIRFNLKPGVFVSYTFELDVDCQSARTLAGGTSETGERCS